MQKLVKQRSKKAGLPPGSMVHIGEKKREASKGEIISYHENGFNREEFDLMRGITAVRDDSTIQWINIDGLSQVDMIEAVGRNYGLHPLVMEDILNTDQRPKVEDYGDYLYIVAKVLYYDSQHGEFSIEQESLILGRNYVLSFGEKDSDVFGPVRERLANGIGRIRKMGADYLVYTLLDCIVDNYFVILEKLGDKIELTEDLLVVKPTPKIQSLIHRLRRQMLFLHKSVWPLREVLGYLERGESQLFREDTKVYFRDVYDHVIQVMDTVETLRDVLSGMLDIYLSSISNRMNEIMKVLTIISTVFIPITFIVGLYGMNLRNMPEMNWPWTYPVVWIVMISIAVFMLAYFKKKKWW